MLGRPTAASVVGWWWAWIDDGRMTDAEAGQNKKENSIWTDGGKLLLTHFWHLLMIKSTLARQSIGRQQLNPPALE